MTPIQSIPAVFTSKGYVSFWYCKQCDCGVVISCSFIIQSGHCPDCMSVLEASTNIRQIRSYITVEVEADQSKNHEPN